MKTLVIGMKQWDEDKNDWVHLSDPLTIKDVTDAQLEDDEFMQNLYNEYTKKNVILDGYELFSYIILRG